MNWAAEAIRDKLCLLGREMYLKTPEGEQPIRAFLEPVFSTAQSARTSTAVADGYFPPGSYQYFGPPEADVSQVRLLRDGTDYYEFRRTECCRCGNTALYWWGLLIGCGGGDE